MTQKISTKSNEKKPLYQINDRGEFAISYLNSDYQGNGIRLLKRTYPAPSENICEPTLSEHLIALHTAYSTHIEKRIAGDKKQEATTHPGKLTFIPAFRHSCWNWATEMEFFLIYLSNSLLNKVANETFDKSPQSIKLIDRLAIEDPFLKQLDNALQDEIEGSDSVNQLYVESLQNVIAVHLLRHHCNVELGEVKLTNGGLSQAQQRKVIDFIMANLDRKMGLEEISKQIEMSPYHFCRLFKQFTGITPYKYVRQQRIKRAKQLLKQKQFSIVDVAWSYGFSSQSSFTVAFRQIVGVTPGQYRISS